MGPDTVAVGRFDDLDAAAASYAAARRSPGAAATLRDDFIRDCLPFARRLAGRYRGRGEPIDDLEQAARVGLVNAVDRYDPDRGSFTAYATITISGEIRRHFRDRTWGVHVPRRVQELALEAGQAASALTGRLAHEPTPAEVALHIGVPLADVTDALASAAGHTPSSLNAPPVGRDGDGEVGDLIGDIDPEIDSVEDRVTVAGLLMRLPARERRIIALRFYGNQTQEQIAATVGISQMHVSRLLNRALSWLREAMLSDAIPAWTGTGEGHHRPIRLRSVHAGTAVGVQLTGEIDRDDADRLRLVLRQAISTAAGRPVLVDLSGVPLLDAAGVAVLLDAANAASLAQVPLHLVGAQPYVLPVLTVTGLAPLLRDRP